MLHYMAQIDVVAAVVVQDGRYLVCQRPGHKRHGGLWEFPGGKVESGEDFHAALVRELAEELGVRVTATGPTIRSHQDPASEFVIHFVQTSIHGTIELSDHASHAWLTPSEFKTIAFAPTDRRFALEILQHGSTHV